MTRLAHGLRRHQALLAACLLFAAVALAASDDFGRWQDEKYQRALGSAVLDYLAGDGERAFDQLLNPHDRFYGPVFEAPLALTERILGLEDRGDVSRGRGILTHLFYLAGGVFCYLLVLRMFGSRALALIAMVLFLLHPRLYAQSFYNSKDVPFLAAFMIALYLVHRAFRRETPGAFLLCGAGAGLLVSLRIMGLPLLAVVLALRALDLLVASGGEERRRILLTAGAFALAAVLTFYGTLPGIWTDPAGQFPEMIGRFRTLGGHGLAFDEWLVRVGITTPPATLLLILTGAVALAWRALRRPRDTLHDGPLRFALLLAVLPVLTVVAVFAFDSDARPFARHLLFLHAPLLLLAIFGLHQLVGTRRRGRWPRAGAYALAGAAMAVALVSMVRIHPYEDNYFSALTDRTTPERLLSRYGPGHQPFVVRGALGDVIADYPSGKLALAVERRYRIVPWSDPRRFTMTRDFRSGERNFYVSGAPGRPCSAPLYAGRVYAGTVWCVVDPVAHFGGYRREALATEPLHRSRFDVYRLGSLMVYLRDGCSPEDMDRRLFLHVRPADGRDGPGERYGFSVASDGVRIDGNCVAVHRLPDYPIARIETGQYAEYAGAARRAVADVEPRARARYDVWLDPGGDGLIYVRENCSAEDAGARFFLHVHPADAAAPAGSFENRDFDFGAHGIRTEDGACVITVPLPGYPIARVRTGQFDASGQLWAAEFAPTE